MYSISIVSEYNVHTIWWMHLLKIYKVFLQSFPLISTSNRKKITLVPCLKSFRMSLQMAKESPNRVCVHCRVHISAAQIIVTSCECTHIIVAHIDFYVCATKTKTARGAHHPYMLIFLDLVSINRRNNPEGGSVFRKSTDECFFFCSTCIQSSRRLYLCWWCKHSCTFAN